MQVAAQATEAANQRAFTADQNGLSREAQAIMSANQLDFNKWSQITTQGNQSFNQYATMMTNISTTNLPQADKDAVVRNLNYMYTGNPNTALTMPPPGYVAPKGAPPASYVPLSTPAPVAPPVTAPMSPRLTRFDPGGGG
jgi:hypothetical protein